MINRNIRILDTTLRDGEQAPGVCFNADLKMQLLSAMIDAGIRDFEIGTPAIGEEECISLKRMLHAGLDVNLSVWCRARIEDLQKAVDLGSKMVNLSLPVSKIQMEAIGKSECWVFDQLRSCLEFSNQYFNFVTVGAQDGSRADYKFLDQYISICSEYENVKRIRIADTVGIMNPFLVQELFQKLTNDFPNLEFEFHGHNDLGMATANGLAAIKGGADVVSGTLNGLGERCGNTPLEELIIALEYSEAIQLDIDKGKLRVACDLVEVLSGRKIHASKPFNGKMCFTHESGIHTRSLLVNELTYQPFSAAEIGQSIRYVFGKHSGSAAVKAVLQQHGLFESEAIVTLLTQEIKMQNKYSSAGYTSEDLIQLYRKLFSNTVKSEDSKRTINYHIL